MEIQANSDYFSHCSPKNTTFICEKWILVGGLKNFGHFLHTQKTCFKSFLILKEVSIRGDVYQVLSNNAEARLATSPDFL